MAGTGLLGLPFGVAPADDMVQKKINEISKDLPNVFGIADGILIEGYVTDSIDHDRTMRQIKQICYQKM